MTFGSGSAALPAHLHRLLGANDQLVCVESAVLTQGTGRGEPVLLVRNPGGVSFEVLLDRALDIGWADARGLPLAWRSPRGRAAVHDLPVGRSWADSFGGGLLATCGLAATGTPSTVGATAYPLHGWIGHLPGEHVAWRLVDEGGRRCVEIVGDVVESSLGAPTLRLRRRILAPTDEPRIQIEDVVTNESLSVAGHMFRHHLNLGYPFVDDATLVEGRYLVADERDPTDEQAITLPWRLEVAAEPLPERVLHCVPQGTGGRLEVVPAGTGMPRLVIDYDLDGFPLLVLWRDASPGVNVLGVEPSTSRDHGRARAERDGEVIWLQPGQSRTYRTALALV